MRTYTYTSGMGYTVKVEGEPKAWAWTAYRDGVLLGGGGLYMARSTARDAGRRFCRKAWEATGERGGGEEGGES